MSCTTRPSGQVAGPNEAIANTQGSRSPHIDEGASPALQISDHSLSTLASTSKRTSKLSTKEPSREVQRGTHHGVLWAPWGDVGVRLFGVCGSPDHRQIWSPETRTPPKSTRTSFFTKCTKCTLSTLDSRLCYTSNLSERRSPLTQTESAFASPESVSDKPK